MELKEIRIELIGASENTRSKVDKKSIADLAQSIEKNGLLQPIGIRKDGKFEKPFEYELIYGFRRLEAFKLLKKESIPAVVYKTDDALSLQIIENLQREDITPLDLAAAIKKYKKESELTFTEIAHILGKTVHEVAKLNRLNDLISPLQKLLREKTLELDTALFVARYPEDEQKDFLKRYGRDERILLKEAKDFFEGRTNKLKNFPWPLDKEFKGLPVCNKCPDRSSQQNVLFPPDETPDDTCLNSKCMEKKIELNLKEKIEETKKSGKIVYLKTSYWPDHRYAPEGVEVLDKGDLRAATKKDDEKDIVKGVIVASDHISNIGQVHNYVKKKSMFSSHSTFGKKRMDELTPAEQLKRRIENYKRKKALIMFPMSKDVALEINQQIKAYDFKKAKVMPVEALAVVAEYVLNHCSYETRKKIYPLWKPNKDRKNLGKIYLMLITAATHYDLENNSVCEYYSGSEWFRRLKEIAGVLGIDLKQIEKKVRPKYDKQVTTLKEKFISKNKIDPDKPIKSKSKKGVKR